MRYLILLFVLSILVVSAEDINSGANTNTLNNEFEEFFIDEYQDSDGKEVNDPLIGYNRVMTQFNDKFYLHIFTPVARGYQKVLPENVRLAISNFFQNIFFPIRFTNNLLQQKYENVYIETQRFVINSTIGIVGLADPAKEHFNLEQKDEDFGQTFGYYGAGPGFHIVLPILGSSNFRDLVGKVGDGFISPIVVNNAPYGIPDKNIEAVALHGVYSVNKQSFNPDEYINIKKDAIDLYTFMRDVYEQRREKLIKE